MRFSINKLFSLLTLVLVIAYVSLANPTFSLAPRQAGFTINPEQLKRHVQTLSSPPFRSVQNQAALDSAANYIRQEWEQMGYTVQEQPYDVQGKTQKNIMISYGPTVKTDKPVVHLVVGAHYDVCMDLPGADDNASGVAGLIEIARLLKKLNPETEYQIDLVAYTLEEPPYYDTEWMGSYIHAKSMAEAKAKIDLMISLEMIGYYSDEENSQTFPLPILGTIYPTTGNFISIIGNTAGWNITRKVKSLLGEVSQVPVYSINTFSFIPGIDYSDHRSYWAFNYPALMITDTSFYRNQNYHKPTDTWETLDYTRMSEVVRGVYNVLINF